MTALTVDTARSSADGPRTDRTDATPPNLRRRGPFAWLGEGLGKGVAQIFLISWAVISLFPILWGWSAPSRPTMRSSLPRGRGRLS